MSLDPVWAFALRATLAGVFAAAAAHKLRDPAGFRVTLRDYRLLPDAALGLAGPALAGLELALAVGLLVPAAAGAAALGALGLLGLYAAAIAVNLARGRRHVACGCFGPSAEQPLHAGLLVRNGLLAAACLAASLPAAPRALGALDGFTIVAATATGWLLLVAADGLMAARARAFAPRLEGMAS